MRPRTFFISIAAFVVLLYATLWVFSFKSYDVTFGISFNQNHAASLGLDWRETYSAMLGELQPETIRIAAMWNQVNPEKGVFDFADVDWMMERARAAGTQVVLVVGQKAPRWPECHVPAWIDGYGADDVEADLFEYVTAVVERYREHPALEYWQVENEAFIHFKFGECEGFRRDLVEQEVDLVRELDPVHPIIMTDSGELSTWRKPSQLSDILGTTLYRVVQTPRGMTLTYDWLPAGFYKAKAWVWGDAYEHFFVSELQAEPWFTDSDPLTATIEEQEQTMDPERMLAHIDYAQRVGASRAYLWGVEWWYFMKEHHGDARYWEIAKEAMSGK